MPRAIEQWPKNLRECVVALKNHTLARIKPGLDPSPDTKTSQKRHLQSVARHVDIDKPHNNPITTSPKETSENNSLVFTIGAHTTKDKTNKKS